MEFEGIKQIPIDQLGLSQIYLSGKKIAAIKKWFDPHCMENFSPLPVHDFGNHIYTLTDGHTRAYVAYKSGLTALPAVYDLDDIITNQTGQMLYKEDIEWCGRFHLSHIKDLGNRILDKAAYQKLWVERCDRSFHLLTQTSSEERVQLQRLAPDLFLYGASQDIQVLFFEDGAGRLYIYKENTLYPEK